MVVKEWKCDEHGYFEGTEAVCPQGCTEHINQVFLTPVAYKSDRSKGIDKTSRQLAMDFNMSDIKTVKEGERQPQRFQPKVDKNAPPRPQGVMWGNPTSIGQYGLRSVAGENVNGLAALRQSGAQLTKPKAASFIADHENLKIK